MEDKDWDGNSEEAVKDAETKGNKKGRRNVSGREDLRGRVKHATVLHKKKEALPTFLQSHICTHVCRGPPRQQNKLHILSHNTAN